MLRYELFVLVFLLTFIVIIGLQELFTQTVHDLDGQTDVFRYNSVPWVFLIIMSFVLVGFGEFARRKFRDRFIWMTSWLGVLVFGFISLQLLCERVEVSEQMLKHRREPPHTKYNVDLPWGSVVAATKIRREKPGLFRANYFHVGYKFSLSQGKSIELPSNTVLTHAESAIDSALRQRGIELDTQDILLQD